MTTDKAKPPRINPTHEYGKAEALQVRFGINIMTGELLAAIIIFGANIEFHLEQAIWQLRGQPIPAKPDTDAKMISSLIDILERVSSTVEDEAKRQMLATWCAAARAGFIIRNNIAHGVTIQFAGGSTMMMRNPGWGVERKRSFGSFTADVSVLTMVWDSFSVLLRIIHAVSVGKANLAHDKLAMRALNEARSILGEFADHTYGPHFEKY